MKIFIDIGHPAHVHYFRNFIKIMESRGHEFLITAREREHGQSLLHHFKLPFNNRGKGGKTVAGKIWYLLVTVRKQYLRARKFQPDLFLDFSTIYSGPAARLLRKPYVTFTDTENTGLYRRFIKPFSKAVYTPDWFKGSLGSQHYRFNGFMELAYLHPRYFEPDPLVVEKLGIPRDEKFSIVRFVSWEAVHDRGKSGFDNRKKIELVKTLRKFGKVLISAEGPLPEELEPLRLKIPSHLMHHLLFYASLLVGESATMSTEAAILGTPAIYLSHFKLGNLLYLEEKYGLVLNFGNSEEEQSMAIKSAEMLMGDRNPIGDPRRQAEKLLDDHIDVTRFMTETIERVYGRKAFQNINAVSRLAER